MVVGRQRRRADKLTAFSMRKWLWSAPVACLMDRDELSNRAGVADECQKSKSVFC